MIKDFKKLIKKVKKRWLQLSFNQKLIISLTSFLVLIGISQVYQGSFYGNRMNKGDIKIFINKYQGDSWNTSTQDEKREYVNKASIRVSNNGTGPVVLTSVACMLPSIARVRLFGTSEQKLDQSESILYEINDDGDKVQFCEVRDSLGNIYQKWDTSYRNEMCWKWNETLGGLIKFILKYKSGENSRAIIKPLTLFLCTN